MAGQDKRDERAEQAPEAAQAEPGGADRQPGQAATAKPSPAAAKAAKLVFTDPLSRQTSDDTDTGWGDSEASRGLDWYRSQRPPHHGD
ncbi:hypothetical protein [Kitasatospora kifunensis]|uniref:Uncharacterized protein n=1 Tax=Kitasatospora kifunensis TaxID=58351 RepID=A0A7W7R2G4_KITKI|nr:hypothetical protein [Kitasatospora kifunensis]MBB4923978.1 hypothetical protein [Kitasatospora kifunensis]